MYTYYKSLVVSNNSDTLPRLRIYISKVVDAQNQYFNLDPKFKMLLAGFVAFGLLLLCALRKFGLFKMRTVESDGEIG